jgi:hypothetical protein
MHRSIKVALAAAAFGAALLPNISAHAATFGTPVVVTSNDVSEPGIEVAPDGTLYIHGPAGIPLWSDIWRSDNGGSSWLATSNLTRIGLGGGDIDMTVQPNGKLAFTDLWLGSSSVGQSSDKGNTWITNQFQGVAGQDRQWLANTGRDIVYHVTHQLGAGLIVSKSLDGGTAYVQHSLAASTLDQNNCICPPGTLVAQAGTATTLGGAPDLVGLTDKVGVVYTTQTGVGFAYSTNGGVSWTHQVVDSIGGGRTMDAFPVVSLDASTGKLHAVWLDNSGSSAVVMYSTAAGFGSTWSSPTAIVSSGTSVFPWIDARAGKIAVSLYHTTASGNPSTVSGSATWNIKYLENTGTGWGTLTTADSTAVKTGPICVDGINCSADRELGDFQMVVIDNNGKANIAYDRSVDGNFDTEIRFVKQTS